MVVISMRNAGIYLTLRKQLDKLAKHNRHGSYKTRERYFDAMKRFCAFLAENYRLQKLSNISDKHLEAYVVYLQASAHSAAYIKTELSAIRLFHDLMPNPRHRLPANNVLNLERRRFGEVDRTWTETEFEDMRQRAVEQGRDDYADMLTLIRHTGLRLHECARLDTAAAESTLRSGLLVVKGKGGKVRSIPCNDAALEVLRRRLSTTRRGCKLFVADDVKTDAVMNGLEQFLIKNRDDNQVADAALTAHGLRHSYAVERYTSLMARGCSDFNACKQVSQWLGHERADVTRIYLASLNKSGKGDK